LDIVSDICASEQAKGTAERHNAPHNWSKATLQDRTFFVMQKTNPNGRGSSSVTVVFISSITVSTTAPKLIVNGCRCFGRPLAPWSAGALARFRTVSLQHSSTRRASGVQQRCRSGNDRWHVQYSHAVLAIAVSD
jgi:hypothetical protein